MTTQFHKGMQYQQYDSQRTSLPLSSCRQTPWSSTDPQCTSYTEKTLWPPLETPSQRHSPGTQCCSSRPGFQCTYQSCRPHTRTLSSHTSQQPTPHTQRDCCSGSPGDTDSAGVVTSWSCRQHGDQHVLVVEIRMMMSLMMMSFICQSSCRNKNQPKTDDDVYTPRVLPTIRGCLEGLALMV
jgi:hypothetical protein